MKRSGVLDAPLAGRLPRLGCTDLVVEDIACADVVLRCREPFAV